MQASLFFWRFFSDPIGILANNANFVRGEVTLQNVHSEYFTTDQFPVGFTEDAVDLSAYKLIGEQVPTVAKKGIISASGYGDINTDGKMTISDAIMLSRYVAEDTSLTLDDAALANADANYDGIVTAADCTSILRAIAGLEPLSDVPVSIDCLYSFIIK